MDEVGKNLREDEIEALLKFDGMTLQVHKHDDLFGNRYYALISGYIKELNETRGFAADDRDRCTAVRVVWEKYNKFREVAVTVKRTLEWIYEDAEANVIKQLIKNANSRPRKKDFM